MKATTLITAAALSAALANPAAAAELDSDEAKVSYAMGRQAVMDLQQRGLPEDYIDIDAFVAGFRDAIGGKQPQITTEQLQAAVAAVQQRQKADFEQLAQANLKKSQAFLAKNKKQKGVKTTDSGLQYKVIEEGSGNKPSASDTVKVHYRGTLPDGTEFDSSYERGQPTQFALDGIIPGWQEALQMMPVGSKWRIFLPPELAYGPRGQGNVIGPNQALVFDIELLEIAEKQ